MKRRKPKKLGLLGATSRKQASSVNISDLRESGRGGLFFQASQAATGTNTLYTVPNGKQARLVYFSLNYAIGGGIGAIQVNGFDLLVLQAVGVTTCNLTYDTGIFLTAGNTVSVRAAIGGTSQASIIVVEEFI